MLICVLPLELNSVFLNLLDLFLGLLAARFVLFGVLTLQFRQQTQQQCESLIQRSRQEAAGVQDGANRYAEQTLGELEVRLKEMAQVVMAGRQELSKIQTIRSATPAANGGEDSKTVPISRAHRAASRLRSMRGNG